MPWLAPRTWVAGELVTAAMMNGQIRDLLNSLRNEHFSVQRFAGLRMGTDRQGNGASRITIFDLDEIVMQDGYRYSGTAAKGWIGKEANIAINGAGGLDTGAEAASTWYEVYAIAKSSDDTKSTLLHKARTYPTSPSQTAGPSSYSLRINTSRERLWQGFVASASAPLAFIDVFLTRVGSPSGIMWFSLESDSAGKPSGTILAQTDTISVAQLASTTSTYYRFYFRSLPSLVSGTTYHIVARGNFTIDGTNYVTWSGSTANPYAGGAGGYFDGTNYVIDSTFDFVFGIRQQVETSLVLPTGYDRYCRIGFVRNNSSSDFTSFQQVERTISYRGAFALGTFTNAVPQLADLESVIPPIPCIGLFSGGHSVADSPVVITQSDSPNSSDHSIIKTAYVVVANAGTPGAQFPEVLVEAQAVYAYTSVAGTAQVHAQGYRW